MKQLAFAARLVLAWAFTAALVTPVVVFTAITLGRLSERLVSPIARLWGRTILAIFDVELVVEGARHLEGRRPRIFVFNHASTLDLPIVAAVFPPGGLGLGKKELLWIPFIGLAWWALGLLFLDRSNPRRARESIERAARILARDARTAIIAPEGTRSLDGRLGPFKMGAFHLGLLSRAPIVPAAVHGAAELLPHGSWRVKPGRIRVEVLDPVSTDHWTEPELRQRSEEVRSLIARRLGHVDSNTPSISGV